MFFFSVPMAHEIFVRRVDSRVEGIQGPSKKTPNNDERKIEPLGDTYSTGT